MYVAYALETTSGFCAWLVSTAPVGFSFVRIHMRAFVIPTPSIEAPKPTHSSLAPLRIGAAARCAKDHEGNPAGPTHLTAYRCTQGSNRCEESKAKGR